MPRDVRTDWDQGALPLVAMEDVLRTVLERTELLGADICGECSAALDYFEERREAAQSSRVNGELLDLLLRAGSGRPAADYCR